MTNHSRSRSRGAAIAVALGAALALLPSATATAAGDIRYHVSLSGSHATDSHSVDPFYATTCTGSASQSTDRETVTTASTGVLTVTPQRGQDPPGFRIKGGRLRIKGGNLSETLYSYQRNVGTCTKVDRPDPPVINTCRDAQRPISNLSVSVTAVSRTRARLSVQWPTNLPGCASDTFGEPATSTVSLAKLLQGRRVAARLSFEKKRSYGAEDTMAESQRWNLTLAPMPRR